MGVALTTNPCTRGPPSVTRILELRACFQGVSSLTCQAWSVHVLVTDPEGRLRANDVIERFESVTVPRVNVTPAWGGAAITWIRGDTGAPTLRARIVQPDGTLRGLARDVARVPNADGALVTLTRGREITFVARDSIQGNLGISFGRACL